MLPVREAERRGLGAAASAGQIQSVRVGSGLSRTWRSSGVTGSSTTADRYLRAVRGCSSAGRPTSARLFFETCSPGARCRDDASHHSEHPDITRLMKPPCVYLLQTSEYAREDCPVACAHRT